ncbi:OmpA family protein [uncultured Lacinutrix sp.]|uniref:OmpA family protein n=1 Tax=uncultured Lacinutrix sp. TaxID=574032 RepID=UPI00260A2CD7|nr:OmpA family protein [uncultured Lacinutrix sp.]
MNSLLGDSENIIVSNITIKGSKKTFGLFKTNLLHNTFFKEGVIMSTGIAEHAEGPNDDTKKSSKINFESDKDINVIADNKGCYDTSLFEFDLISATDEIEFKYCFASEEYPEYIFKNVNDVFIFLVTNTETNTSKNIALLNGDSNTPITVDHINPEVNSEYYIANYSYNISTIETLLNNEKHFELAKSIQYDGFTTVLTAKTKVVPNVKYHFKLGISDVGDQLYDSAIFLEANSLKSTGTKPGLLDTINNLETEISLDFQINFETASSKIVGEHSFLLLDAISKTLLNKPEININIIGHTDAVGTNIYNKELSLSRANTVRDYFIANGINSSRITTTGMGEEQLKSSVSKDNRRVEIVFSK